ncbi:hypothetical protein [Pseudomonas sp. CGJS7]|uniref:hypothetical protein n=1 Tax=Pseudomonas sp. CGJS7 TaxID=3109348 RepID=UPI003008FFBC
MVKLNRLIALGATCIALSACDRSDPDAVRSQDTVAMQPAATSAPPKPVCPNGRDPSSVYAITGKTIFKFPRRAPDSTARLRPDEGDLGECVEHPRPIQVLSLAQVLKDLSENEPNKEAFPQLSRPRLYGHHPNLSLQRSNQYVAASRGPEAQCQTRSSGLEICSGHGPIESAETTILRVPLAEHSTPDGHAFVVLCGLGPSLSRDDCGVDYQLSETVSLSYNFDRSKFPIDQIVEVDRMLRKKVDDLVVGGYR